nr:hypothetical protein [Streptomyces sp. TRM68416]
MHGPAGVGKSALAAEAVRRYVEERERSGSHPVPVHWLSLGDTVDVEGVLLRLLAESGAPRGPVLRAALGPDRKFGRTLRNECGSRLGERVVVLDDVRPAAARRLLSVLRLCDRLTVIITSRRKRGWRHADRLYEVGPLEPRDAAALFSAVSGSSAEVTPAAGMHPQLVRIAGALVRELPPHALVEERPDVLVLLALQQCTPQELHLLDTLAARPSRIPFGLRSLHWDGELDGLLSKQLVRRWRKDEFFLPAPVGDAVRRYMSSGRSSAVVASDMAEAAGQTAHDTAARLDGRPERVSDHGPSTALTPAELAWHIDEFMTLMTDARGPRGMPRAGQLAAALAPTLAVLRDAHRLVALHRRMKKRREVHRALCSLARGLGLLTEAQALLDGDTSPYAVHERAANHQHRGHLDDALAALGPEPETEDLHAAWNLLVRGAVLCDQGKVLEATRHLQLSAHLHRMFDCPRGRGWALLHLARVSLLRGLTTEAGRQLAQAERTLRSVGDVRGQNWVATERVRLQGQLGAGTPARDTAEEAIAAHKSAGDLRGVGWTHLWLGRLEAASGRVHKARWQWAHADEYFALCQDALGHAWTQHRTALLPPPDGYRSPGVGVEEWLDIHREFVEIGCTHGRAWTLVELAARVPGAELSAAFLSTADTDFELLDDSGGRSWVRAVQAVHGGDPHRFAPLDPVDMPWADQLTLEISAFLDAGGDRGIPARARDLVLTSSGDDLAEAGPGLRGPRCRVRITLLDESPTAGTTSRLLVRVSPQDGHPWAVDAEAAPWLTATALPLTRASLEPASALLRPSRLAEHGAEFDFVPHRTGTHRIRFTIALERTGTVLQQVETELDILDNDEPGSRGAPHAVTPRGR